MALIDSDVRGKKLRLQVDTGFNAMLVYGSRLDAFATAAETGARVAGVAQHSGVRSLDPTRVQIGDWQESLPIAVLQTAPRDFHEFDGLVGPRFLGAKRVAFDFEHRMLYWD